MNSLGEVVDNAMELVEERSEQLSGVLPKDYTIFSDELLAELGEELPFVEVKARLEDAIKAKRDEAKAAEQAGEKGRAGQVR